LLFKHVVDYPIEIVDVRRSLRSFLQKPFLCIGDSLDLCPLCSAEILVQAVVHDAIA